MVFAQKYDLKTRQLQQSIGDSKTRVTSGLGNCATLLIFLQLMSKRQILPATTTTITQELATGNGARPSLLEGTVLSADQLTRLMLATSAPAAALVMCKLVREQTGHKMGTLYHQLANYSMLKSALANQTGRIRQSVPQSYDMKMLLDFGWAFATLPDEYRDLMHQTDAVQQESYLYAPTMLVKRGALMGGYFFGASHGEAIAFDSQSLYVVLGAGNGYDRDVVLSQLMAGETTRLDVGDTKYAIKKVVLPTEKPIINLMGDVYPGEFYTARRQKRQRWDPLEAEGYTYTFAPMKAYLQRADVNIFNMESALVDDRSKSRLWDLKKFVLGSQPEPTLAAFKETHLNVALMANNHGGDYAQTGFEQSLTNLKQADIPHVGVGRDIDEATNPIRLETKQGNLTIFNAYWYHDNNYRTFNTYPLFKQAGVAPIMRTLYAKIRTERAHYPNNWIIVSPHWGVDFKEVTSKQRLLARKLIQAGADIIAGHGAHAFQSIEMIDGHPVIYGLGNAFFNSDGEYDTHPNALPYGGILRMQPQKKDLRLTLHFLNADNHVTKFQPRLVDESGFKKLYQGLEEKKSDLTLWQVNEEHQSLVMNYERKR